MGCSCILITCIQFYVLVILATIRLGSANYLATRSRERNLNSNNGVKTETESSHIGGEVFVPKTFSLNSQEPTCEQLRAMWIFSKRQSRAAEITNEIPTYRDPFTYNVWEPLFLNSQFLGSLRMSAKERARSPVFGRVVSREPNTPQRIPFEHHQRLVEFGSSGPSSSQNRYYGAETRPQQGASLSSRRSSKNRYMGVPNGTRVNAKESQNSVAIQGSFQKLKELIWTERAKELTEQRRDEELAARAAALKEIANGKNILANYVPQLGSSDSILMDENRSPDGNSYQLSDINRMSILNEQNFQSDKNNKNGHKSGIKATTRRIGNSPSYNKKESQANKEIKALLFGKNGISQANRAARIKLPATELFSSDVPERDYSIIGIPRTYPIRKSHFRERNRSLFKEPPVNDNFQRYVRGLTKWPLETSTQNKEKELRHHLETPENFIGPQFDNYVKNVENVDNLKMLIEKKPNSNEFELGLYDFNNY
ncbi:uncharacterized protein LOC108101719 [Drosophila ficusphila]|uniref:uncharacterized protein LOC108101719 n=1 Tax=Drosophila ficusphila TaxID=30025 RepID=UPI0007E6FCEA|nr:uncharacterized protein LOC108101719 [Drosophila ficusphila]XP_017061653.1 uncharacterized protein LOC108101719 [Drosophila ficusphila]XP_017061654.1 uncharacterized protein LOC108101719 [Drosophila ficusphila]XP_017061655.1 uncharacterized protein LOC108101719 [Drosophila ficusphila]XP_017061656.1 uncharacterized protein LOC108101719 [Drosophila ficusphila]XP_017061657.1 uncharacterized protein LOC108101719 [Drosophila ficusphila]